MRTLTLTYEERKAIDWVGYRYAHGDDLRELLFHDIVNWQVDKVNIGDVYAGDMLDWNEKYDITFKIPKKIVKRLIRIAKECEYHWDCFSQGLADKLTKLCKPYKSYK